MRDGAPGTWSRLPEQVKWPLRPCTARTTLKSRLPETNRFYIPQYEIPSSS